MDEQSGKVKKQRRKEDGEQMEINNCSADGKSRKLMMCLGIGP